MKLEELARKSSDAARISVVHLDPPPIAEPTPRRFATPALIGFAGLLMLLGVGALVLLNNSGDDGEISTAAAPEVPRLGFPAFDSWEVTGAYNVSEIAEEEGVNTVMTFSYYGAGESADPYREGDLLIGSFEAGGDAVSLSGDTDRTVQVRGVTAVVVDSAGQGLGDETVALEWEEPNADPTLPPLQLFAASKSLTEAELIAVVENLEVDVAAGTAAPIETGLELVATENATPFDSFRGADEGYLVAYERSPEALSESLVVTSRVGELRSERAALQWWGAQTEDVTVNGRPGYTASLDGIIGDPAEEQDGFTSRTVVWTPSNGVVASVIYFGNNPDFDIVEVASAAVELDDDTWAAYQQQAAAVSANSADFSEIYLGGEGSVGDEAFAFVLGLQGGQLCFDLASGSGSTGSCGGGSTSVDDPTEARVIDNGFGDTLASVVIVAGADVDEIVVAGDDYVTFAGGRDSGEQFFVAVGPSNVQPRFDVIVDGEVVATLEAGVEELSAGEEAFALDVASNPSAQASGIADLDVIANLGDDRVPVAFGTKGNDLCIVTFGEAVSAGCAPANDFVVFGPVQLEDGTSRTHVVLDISTIPCIDTSIGVSFSGSVPWVGQTGGNDWVVAAIEGPAEGINVEITTTSGTTEVVELPDIEGTGTWPADICRN